MSLLTEHPLPPVARPAYSTARQQDADLERRVASFFQQRGIRGIRGLAVVVRGGVVSLSGRAATRFDRDRCLECCRRVAGVVRVIDNLRIAAPARADGQVRAREDLALA